MRYIKFSLLIATFLWSAVNCAAQPPAKVTQSETTIERENRILNEQKAAERQRLYLQLIVIGAIAFPIIVVGWIVLTRRAPDRSRRLVELAPMESPSKWSALSDYPVAVLPQSHLGVEPCLPAMPLADSLPDTNPGEELPYIIVRTFDGMLRQRLARIYVFAEELLVIDTGECGDVTASVFSGGGAHGSSFGGSAAGDNRATNGGAYLPTHGGFDPTGPVEWSKSGGDFRARFADLVDVSIVPSFGSSHCQGASRAAGTLRFRHRGHGDYSFEILSLVEVRGAIRLLSRALGNALHVSKEWDDLLPSYLSSL